MRALDLLEQHPVVDLTGDALDAARLMAERHLPGLVVRGDARRPFTVLPADQVLRFVIPGYLQDNPALARVVDERTADTIATALRGKTVADVMPQKADRTVVPRVDHDATIVEVAAVMASSHSPIVVVGQGDEIIGVITVRRLLGVLFPGTGDDPGDLGDRGNAGDARDARDAGGPTA